MSADTHVSPINQRLGLCEVCATTKAKYTCPECEVKTCSLRCCTVHKKELKCSGVRNRVKYVPLNKFSDLDLLSDYRLLEETNRRVDSAKKSAYVLNANRREQTRVHKLSLAASRRDLRLMFLPPKFTRHIQNTTYLDRKSNCLLWKLEWHFPSSNYTCSDSQVLDSTILGDALSNHLDGETEETSKLTVYKAAGLDSGVKVLMKADAVHGCKYFIMDLKQSLCDNFRRKIIIEFPIFHVILTSDLHNYNIVHLAPIKKENKNLLEDNGEYLSGED